MFKNNLFISISCFNQLIHQTLALADRDAGGAGLIRDPPHPHPIGAGMGTGLMGHGAGTGIKFIPTAGMGMGMGFRWYPLHPRPAPPHEMYKFWKLEYPKLFFKFLNFLKLELFQIFKKFLDWASSLNHCLKNFSKP